MLGTAVNPRPYGLKVNTYMTPIASWDIASPVKVDRTVQVNISVIDVQ